MTASQLRAAIEASGREQYFFDRGSMRFFGDTMRNYGCRAATIERQSGGTVEAFELYRRKPVKYGNQKSAYFDATTFARVFPK